MQTNSTSFDVDWNMAEMLLPAFARAKPSGTRAFPFFAFELPISSVASALFRFCSNFGDN